MNYFSIFIAATLFSLNVFAAKVPSAEIVLQPSELEKVIRLEEKNDYNTGHEKILIVVSDKGLSTDVSPRYGVYLSYANLAEMGIIRASFSIANALQFVSAKKVKRGVYQVKTIEYRSNGDEDSMFKVTYTVDATQVIADEAKQREECAKTNDFCDSLLETSINVTERATKTTY